MTRKTAVIPKHLRISSITSRPDFEGEKGGVTLGVASASEYQALNVGVTSWGKTFNSSDWDKVKKHGIGVSCEIFDSVLVGIPFKCTELVGELKSIGHLKEKSQYVVINATLRWLSIQDDPQAKRCIGGYVLTKGGV